MPSRVHSSTKRCPNVTASGATPRVTNGWRSASSESSSVPSRSNTGYAISSWRSGGSAVAAGHEHRGAIGPPLVLAAPPLLVPASPARAALARVHVHRRQVQPGDVIGVAVG